MVSCCWTKIEGGKERASLDLVMPARYSLKAVSSPATKTASASMWRQAGHTSQGGCVPNRGHYAFRPAPFFIASRWGAHFKWGRKPKGAKAALVAAFLMLTT